MGSFVSSQYPNGIKQGRVSLILLSTYIDRIVLGHFLLTVFLENYLSQLDDKMSKMSKRGQNKSLYSSSGDLKAWTLALLTY